MYPDRATIRPATFDEDDGQATFQDDGSEDYTVDCRSWIQRVHSRTDSGGNVIRILTVVRIPIGQADTAKEEDRIMSIVKNGAEHLLGDPGVTPSPSERQGNLLVRWVENHRLARELWCEERR